MGKIFLLIKFWFHTARKDMGNSLFTHTCMKLHTSFAMNLCRTKVCGIYCTNMRFATLFPWLLFSKSVCSIFHFQIPFKVTAVAGGFLGRCSSVFPRFAPCVPFPAIFDDANLKKSSCRREIFPPGPLVGSCWHNQFRPYLPLLTYPHSKILFMVQAYIISKAMYADINVILLFTFWQKSNRGIQLSGNRILYIPCFVLC